MPSEWCSIWLRTICISPTASFPFWEILASLVITGAVTWFTIWAATRSAREATKKSLEHATELQRKALEAAERQARYQQRVREAQVLRQAITTYTAVVRRGGDPHLSDGVQEALRTADAVVEPSLTPGAPQLLRVVMFSLELIPTRDEIEDEWDWNSEVFEREEDILTHVSSWARNPEKALVELVEKADRIATLEFFEAAMGTPTRLARDEALRPHTD